MLTKKQLHSIFDERGWKPLITLANKAVRDSNLEDAQTIVSFLAEAMSESERRLLRSELIRLMKHVIKWKMVAPYPNQGDGWELTIRDSRKQLEHAFLSKTNNRTYIESPSVWEKCFNIALFDALEELQDQFGRSFSSKSIDPLTWDEVFIVSYKRV